MATFVKPDVPGTSIRFVGEAIASVAPSFADVVAVPIVHDWGPVGSDSVGAGGGPRLVSSFSEFERLYGTSDTAGRRAVLMAFNGSGLPGQGGAGGVIVYRMAAAAAAFATRIVTNTTPVTALTLTAKYKGVAGNLLTYTVAADPNDAANDILRLLFNGAEVERYNYVKTSITDLVAQITLKPSPYVTAVANVSGVALTPSAGASFTGGLNGDTLTAGEWTSMLTAMEFENFTLLAPYNLTDAGIQASLLTWVRAMEAANRPVMVVVGGLAAETLSTAITRSGLMPDPHVVNLGVGTYYDELLLRDLSTAELAPRIAGMLAARGEGRSLTFAEIGGLTAVGSTNPRSDEIRPAINAGVTVLSRSSNPDASLRIAQGVTTFTSKVDAARPYQVFSEPRMVRIMDIYIREMRQWADDIVIGDLPVNDDTRALVRGEARRRQEDLLTRGLILADPEPFVNTPVPNTPELLDAVLYEFGWQFARTANYVIGNGRIR